MAATKKSQQMKKQSQSLKRKAGDFGEPSETPLPVPPAPELVQTNIQQHAKKEPASLIDRAKAKLAEMGGEETADYAPAAPTDGKSKSNWRRYSQKAKTEKSKAELATLVSTVFVLLLALWPAPETVKPNPTEVDAFSEHFSSIILRHIDLSGAITGDVLDAIGLVAVLGSWLTRVGPELRIYNEQRRDERAAAIATGTETHKPLRKSSSKIIEAVSKTPIENVSPATKEYLDKLAAEESSGRQEASENAQADN
jgi:hypothetical protein